MMSRYRLIRMEVFKATNRLINRLNYHGVMIYDVTIDNDRISFSIDRDNESKTIAIIEELGLEYDIIRDNSISELNKLCLARIGLVIGFIIIAVLAVIMSQITLFIDIRGANNTARSDIMTALEDSGIRLYSHRSRHLDDAEDKILSTCPSVAYASLRYEGTKLVVKVEEELIIPNVLRNSDGAIIANSDGIITRVIVSSGTAVVKAGDTVKRGDVLIEPCRHYGEGEEERVVEVVARGEVYATTYINEDIELSGDAIEYVYTGEKTSVNVIGDRVPISPYDCYDVSISKSRLYGLLPLEYNRYTFSEKVAKTIDIEDENYKTRIIKDVKDMMDMSLIADEKVVREWIFEKRLDNLYIISVYYEVEKLISGGRLEQV